MRWTAPLVRLGCAVAVVASVLVLAACSGDDEPDATATPAPATATATATRVPEATATAIPSPASSPSARRVPYTVLLLDMATGTTTTMFESDEFGWSWPVFSEDEQSIYVMTLREGRRMAIEFDRTGTEVRRDTPEALCTGTGSGPTSGSFEAFICDPLRSAPGTSPDGRWSLARGGSDFPTPVPGPCAPLCFDMWAVNRDTGEQRLLQDALRECGGCDGMFGPRWSPSSRYVAFGETGGPRVFLSDLEAGTTRQIGGSGSNIGHAPHWSPVADVLLLPSSSGGVLVEDLEAGTSRVLNDLEWPARFDKTGAFVYSPAFTDFPLKEPSNFRPAMAILDVSSGHVFALDAGPSYLHLWRDLTAVLATGDTFLAVLDVSLDCRGTTIYSGETPIACIQDTNGGVASPDGARIALARKIGDTGHVEFPGGGALSLPEYEVVLFEVGTGTETVVATGAVGEQPPLFQWTADSAILLVTWPAHSGL